LGAYDDALTTLTKANSLDPNQPATLSVLGTVQYRCGAYGDALKTLTRYHEMRRAAGQSQTPSIAFLAMSLHRLGRVDEAKATLEQLRGLLKVEPYATNSDAKAMLAEAEKLIVGQRP
jgi:Flp pilus assembly protein TadD